ncbi:MAG TPA: helix-turn-helix domain-containing protein [Kutzneria sp.]|jgi:AcrR family transcriptional regulator
MTDRPLRADAQRNRDALLAAAAPAFASRGADASLEEIARQAGVAIGTLYRHFPTREALFVAVHRAEMINVAEHADALLIEHEPLAALRLWLGRFTDFMTAKHGMADAFRMVLASGDNPFVPMRGIVLDALTKLVLACGDELRHDVDGLDILTVLNGISLATSDVEQTARLIDLVLAGLRAPR